MLETFIIILDFLGVAVFAVTGALVASRKRMDIVGFALLATVTGIGGGTLRDLILGIPVFWVQKPLYVAVCLVVAVVTFFTAHIPQSRYRLLLQLDAVGLSFFCVVGAEVALASGAGMFVAIIMGIMTATFGGVMRDVLGGEVPIILRKEIYASAALAGAGVFTAVAVWSGHGIAATIAGFLTCYVIRVLALKWGWSLPPYRARPGRNPDDLGL
jgi:uncharacterized membrane protein YeiH